MRRGIAQIAAALLAGMPLATPAAAQVQQLPPVPRILVDTAALVCVRIDNEGKVDAVLLDPSGDKARDAAVLDWVRQLRFPKVQPGDVGRGTWFPMPLAFGSARSPKLPSHCALQANRT
jgi:hypothetical protein